MLCSRVIYEQKVSYLVSVLEVGLILRNRCRLRLGMVNLSNFSLILKLWVILEYDEHVG